MKQYKSIYKGTEMDASWGKANTAVQGVKVNGEELPKDAEGKVAITLPETYTKDETDALLAEKQNTLVSGENIKTINDQSILGGGNIEINPEPSEYLKSASVSDNTLTLTKKDGTKVKFTPEKETLIITKETPASEWLPYVGISETIKNIILFYNGDGEYLYMPLIYSTADDHTFSLIHHNKRYTIMYITSDPPEGWGDLTVTQVSKLPYIFDLHSGDYYPDPDDIEDVWNNNQPIIDSDSGAMALSYDETNSVLTFLDNTSIIQYTWNDDESIWEKTTIQLATSSDLAGKQDTISDLATIRSGASAGATALPKVQAVEGKIPAQASSTNQLADKDFVNSSINASAAFYITSNASGDAFATKAALLAGPYYNGGVLRTPTKNDYAIVLADESKGNATTRYSYDGSVWAYQYKVNDTPLTAAQLAALNSGITAEKVGEIDDKVDKVAGKGLSTNDYTTAEKNKLAELENYDDTAVKERLTTIEGKEAGWNAKQDALSSQQLQNIADVPNKANTDGYYQRMSVGLADNLAGKGDGVMATFARRTTGGSADVGEPIATLKSVLGNTIIWNQLVKEGAQNFTNYQYGMEINPDGSIGLSASDSSKTHQFRQDINNIYDHYYYTAYIVKSQTPNYIFLKKADDTYDTVLVPSKYVKISSIVQSKRTQVTTEVNVVCSPYSRTIYPAKFDILSIIRIDLTQMFGAGNEPTTVEEFEAMFPDACYPYNEGQLLSFNGTGLKTDGFNQFDGTKARVFGGKAYYINGTYTTLQFAKTLDGTREDITPVNNVYTPTEDGYIFATGVDEYFCINIQWSGIRDGQYEEHWAETLQLPTPADGLRSCGSGNTTTRDEMLPDKDIIRVGERAYEDGDEDDTTLTTDKTNTLYPLAEPIVTEYATPRDWRYRISDFGTETILPEGVNAQGLPLTSPFVGKIAYNPNAVDFIRNADKNFINKASMDSILTALKNAGKISSYTLTYDEVTGKYNCTIS